MSNFSRADISYCRVWGTAFAGFLVLLLSLSLGGCGSISPPPPAPTVSLQAAASSIVVGQSVKLTWNSTNATSVAVAPSFSPTALPLSGSANITPKSTTTYTITATGAGGSATAAATITVNPPPPPPTVTLTATPSTIAGGAAATLTWTTTRATSVSISPSVGSGTLPVNGSASVSPVATTVYIITATGNQQTATASATVTVTTTNHPQSPISHLIVVILQNHSFDNFFGTYPGANGLNPNLPSYTQADANGVLISPTLSTTLTTADLNHDNVTYREAYDNGKMDKYAFTNGDLSMQYFDNTVSGTTKDGKTYSMQTVWSYAQQYALADNFFASAMYSEPANMMYMVAATVHDANTAGKLPYYDKCSAKQQALTGGKIAPPLTETTLGDQLNAAHLSWTWYQGGYATSVDGTCVNYVPQENPFQYFTSTENSANLQDFDLAQFQATLANNALPSVSFITAAPAVSMHPGSGDMSNGIQWLENLVNSVKNSQEWATTAMVVFWDESGGWYDHVPPPQLANTVGLGARVPMIVISPFAKTGAISHQQMDFVSILRFIQWNWQLGVFTDPAQAAREQQTGDMCDLLNVTCASP